jgi:hypothetical protein
MYLDAAAQGATGESILWGLGVAAGGTDSALELLPLCHDATLSSGVTCVWLGGCAQ